MNPLAVSVGAVVCTNLIHTVVVVAIVNLVQLEKRGGRVGKSFWFDIAIVRRATALALVPHLIEMVALERALATIKQKLHPISV